MEIGLCHTNPVTKGLWSLLRTSGSWPLKNFCPVCAYLGTYVSNQNFLHTFFFFFFFLVKTVFHRLSDHKA